MRPRSQQHEQLALARGDAWRLSPGARVRCDSDPFAVARKAGSGAVVLLGHDQWDFNAVQAVGGPATFRGDGLSTLWNFRYVSSGAVSAVQITGDDVTIEDVRIVYRGTRGNSAVGIYAHGCQRLRLRNVTLEGFDAGIVLLDVVDFEIAGCQVLARDAYGIALGSTGIFEFVPDVGALVGHAAGKCRIGRVHGNHVEVRTVAATGIKEPYPTVDAIFSNLDVTQVSFGDNNLEWGTATYYSTTSTVKGSRNAWDDSNVLHASGLTVL